MDKSTKKLIMERIDSLLDGFHAIGKGVTPAVVYITMLCSSNTKGNILIKIVIWILFISGVYVEYIKNHLIKMWNK